MVRESGTARPTDALCRGTILSATENRPDIEEWGYHDARLTPHGTMAPAQAQAWTDGVIAGR